jgi:hypothetical protein
MRGVLFGGALRKSSGRSMAYKPVQQAQPRTSCISPVHLFFFFAISAQSRKMRLSRYIGAKRAPQAPRRYFWRYLLHPAIGLKITLHREKSPEVSRYSAPALEISGSCTSQLRAKKIKLIFLCAPPKGARVLVNKGFRSSHSLRQRLRGETGKWVGRVGWGQGAWAKGGGRKTKAKERMMN